MKKYAILFLLIPTLANASPPSRVSEYTSGTTIRSSEVAGNENVIFSYLQDGVDTYSDGTILNADISSSAAITSSKLDLSSIGQTIAHSGTFTQSGSSSFSTITNLGTVATGIMTAVTINGGAINNVPIGLTTPFPGSFSSVKVGTANQGDVFYDSGTGHLTRLAPGTSGQYLKTQGTGASPVWGSPQTLYTDGTLVEATASTQRDTTNSSFTKLKEFSPLIRGGVISVQWEAARSGGNNCHSRVYINSIAVGEDKTVSAGAGVFETETESSLTVTAGDVIQIYAYNESGGQTSSIKNVSILVSRPSIPLQASGF